MHSVQKSLEVVTAAPNDLDDATTIAAEQQAEQSVDHRDAYAESLDE